MQAKRRKGPAVSKPALSTGWSCLILGLACLILYAPTIDYGFIGYDDTLLIVHNQRFLSDLANVPQAFMQDAWDVEGRSSSDSYYRPLYTLSFMLDSQLGGTRSSVYHFSSILLHAIASCLLLLFLRCVGSPGDASFLLALFFAVHPALVAVVAWVPGRNDSLLAIFVLSSFLLLDRFARHPSRWNLALHLGAFGLAMFTKEAAIVIPILALLYLKWMVQAKVSYAMQGRLLLGWCAILAVWTSLRTLAIGRGQLGWALAVNAWDNAVFLLHYLGKVLLPIQLTLFPTKVDTPHLVGVVALAGLMLALFLSRERRMRHVFFGVCWFLLFLLPTLVVPVLVGLEQRLYTAAAGVALILLEVDWIRSAGMRRRSLAAGLMVAIVLAGLTWTRLDAFSSRRAFWQQGAAGSPHSALAVFNLGTVRLEAGRLGEAELLLKRALEINPGEPMAHNNLGVLYARRGQHAQAAAAFSREIEVNPRYADAYFNLATSRSSSGQIEESVRLWEKTVELNPTHVRALESLSRYYARKGDPERVAHFVERLQAIKDRAPR